jgi:prevent-host-death family protein
VYTRMYMTQSRSVAETRREFSELLHAVESGGAITVTRRGKPIAVLVSYDEHQRAQSTKLSTLLQKWRCEGPGHLDGTEFENLRDRSAGRQ